MRVLFSILHQLLIFLALLSHLACNRGAPEAGSTVTSPAPPLQQLAVFTTAVPEPSGLTYHAGHNSLVTVSDSNSTIYEIDFTGKILSSFVVASVDLEGIALSPGGDTLIVADEYHQVIATYLANGLLISSFDVRVATRQNSSLEGVAVDRRNHLFIVNEKEPRLLLEYFGGKELGRTEITAVRDLSDVCYDEALDCLWIVSDESRMVLRLDLNGTVLASYAIPFSSGEGITIVGDRIYIITDGESKLYVFEKPRQLKNGEKIEGR